MTCDDMKAVTLGKADTMQKNKNLNHYIKLKTQILLGLLLFNLNVINTYFTTNEHFYIPSPP